MEVNYVQPCLSHKNTEALGHDALSVQGPWNRPNPTPACRTPAYRHKICTAEQTRVVLNRKTCHHLESSILLPRDSQMASPHGGSHMLLLIFAEDLYVKAVTSRPIVYVGEHSLQCMSISFLREPVSHGTVQILVYIWS